jgi:hypothetical protein
MRKLPGFSIAKWPAFHRTDINKAFGASSPPTKKTKIWFQRKNG